ncbi:MAG: beta-ketoacyl-[acyl-carrier-protein] synthase family protein [Ktedonobacteraceae bacterium]
MSRARARRVVVTGMGVVAPHGMGLDTFWQASVQGLTGIKPLRRFSVAGLPIQVAGEWADFQATAYLPRKFVLRTDRVTHFTSLAVDEALSHAQLDLTREDPTRVGAVIANTMGGVEFVLKQIEALFTRGPRAMSAYTAIAWLQIANVGQISLRHNVQGYCKTPVNDLAGGLEAMLMATQAIRRGVADILITGGSEALLHPCLLQLLGHDDLCASGDDPRAYRPFDQRARGLLLAEGAGICILEEYEHARQRQAPIYGEIVGGGATNDARGSQAPTADGAHYAQAMRLALQDADLQPAEVDYFSLDGRAHPVADFAEVAALREVFGARLPEIPVSVPRTAHGHSYAAAGALDTITTLLALQTQQIPPTLNCEQLDPRYQLNLVREQAQSWHGSAALIGARGISGTNLVLAVRRGIEL